jgi:hypothetical protein
MSRFLWVWAVAGIATWSAAAEGDALNAAPPPLLTRPTSAQSSAAGSPAHAAAKKDDDEDEVDPLLAAKVELYPWTEAQNRSVLTTFLPSAVPIARGHFNYRISHVALQSYYSDLRTNLLGLDDNVRIGIELGYGIWDDLDVTLQRVNGHDLQVPVVHGDAVSFDAYDLLFRYRVLTQASAKHGGIADVALIGGSTIYLVNHGQTDFSVDLGVMAERSMFSDRLRVGVGVVHAGLSYYERTLGGIGPESKLFPSEVQAAELAGTPVDAPEKSTTAIPISLKIALDEHWQLFGDMIVPIAGWSTHEAPTLATGFRLNTHTHEYSFYVANSGNASFAGAITGGNTGWGNLPLFGFSITAHL